MFTVSALETLRPSEADVAAIEKYVVETMTPSLIGVPESETARPCYQIPIPGTSLTVVADLPGFVPTMFGVGKEGNIERLFFAVRDKTHFHVGIQRKVTEQTPQAYRSLYWSEVQRIQRALPNGMHQIIDVSMSDTQKMAILEYTSQDHMKVMNIRHADGFMVKDDIGIHVLVSKRHFASGDEQELRNILATVQLKER